jgi:hypothetical protein
MTIVKSALALSLATLFSTAAFAQQTTSTAPTPVDRNVNQQQRIENGLQSGQLNTKEAGRLEREETHVERLESRAAADGTVTTGEAKRIDAAQDAVSKNIYRQKHDAQIGNPNSASSQRLQADVQRNVNQQERIANGIDSGTLTTREAGALEHGQARVTRKEANAAADGHVGAHEEARIQRTESRQSGRVFAKKHNGRTAN